MTSTTAPAPTLDTVTRRLKAVGQEHLLAFYPGLSPEQQRRLLAQIAALDVEALPGLIKSYVLEKPTFALPPSVKPAPFFPLKDGAWDRVKFREAGRAMLRAGRVAAFVVAGGQGSRLGYEGPKGCYPAGAVTGKPLFEVFAAAILGAQDRYGRSVPWYVMTSPLNHEATVAFFRDKKFFGLDPKNVMFFAQGVMPSLDIKTGKVLLSAKDEVATNPDGHGGSLKALHASGALADMTSRGVDTISYFQVDNPIVNLLDPVFLGLHDAAAESSRQMSSKMVAKVNAEEKVGVFCAAGAGPRAGRVEVVEYSDLPMEYQRRTRPDGTLEFLAGSIAVHILGVKFVERLCTDASFALPYHRAEKKIPCVDPATGAALNPTTNNGVKLERFVFDALPMCEKSVVLETDRVEEFAPIKNASGADSPESCSAIQTIRAARWLEAAGVKVPRRPDGTPDCVLEVSPRTASTAEELAASKHLPRSIERGQKLAL